MSKRKPSVEITPPGQRQGMGRRIALTVKIGPEDYQRLETLKARRMIEGHNAEATTQALLATAVHEFLDNNGV